MPIANGFLALDDCEVYLASSSSSSSSSSISHHRSSTTTTTTTTEQTETGTEDNLWFDVEIPGSRNTAKKNDDPNGVAPNVNESAANQEKNKDNDNDNGNVGQGDNGNRCPWCHLVLELRTDSNADADAEASSGKTIGGRILKLVTTTGMVSSSSDDDANGERHSGTNGRTRHDDDFHARAYAHALRYDGTIQDTKCNRCNGSGNGNGTGDAHGDRLHNHGRQHQRQRQRSDAALMMGLALAAQDYDHIAIQSIKVGLYKHHDNKYNNNNNNNNNRKDSGTFDSSARHNEESKHGYRYWSNQRACLLISFACREIVGLPLGQKQTRRRQSSSSSFSPFRIGPTCSSRPRRRFLTEDSKKALPPATQLVLSIMSSDWREYDAKIAGLSFGEWNNNQVNHHHDEVYHDNYDTHRSGDKADTKSMRMSSTNSHVRNYRHRTPVVSFFPSRMNLEDVFQRIGGVSSSSLLLSDPEDACSFVPARDQAPSQPAQMIETCGGNDSNTDSKCRANNNNSSSSSEKRHQQKTVENVNTISNTQPVRLPPRRITTTTTSTATSTSTSTATRTITLHDVPADILCHRIGRYLRAKSLDALRCTCKHLHWTLRSVVPGLVLNLYSHQIKSLMWMRGRETKQITEDGLLVTKQTNQQQQQQWIHQEQEQEQLRRQWKQRNNHHKRRSPRIVDQRKKEGDVHRAATGGGTVLLCERPRQCHPEEEEANDPNNSNNQHQQQHHANKSAVPVRISQLDFCEVIHRDISSSSNNNNNNNTSSTRTRTEDPLSRKVARGGLLCDDPGLGKTITVISLILQTMGLTTEKDIDEDKDATVGVPTEKSKSYVERVESQRQNTAKEKCDDDDDDGDHDHDETTLGQPKPENTLSSSEERIFYEYWREQIIPEFRCKALTKLFSTFLRSSRDVNLFFDNYWLKVLQAKAIDAPSYPLSLKDIRRRLDKYDALQGFVSDVEASFQSAISSNLASDTIREAAQRLLAVFRIQIVEFKKSQIEVAIKSFSRASAKPDSIVAALVEKTNSEKLKSALVPSLATLLVVPAVLVDHWMEQLKVNVDVAYCTTRIPLVFEFTGSNKTELRIEETMAKCRVKKSHFPFIFVDRTATKKLPSPSFLAIFRIVITTNNRFSAEWKNGSFEDEMRRNRNQDTRGNGYSRWTDFREDLASSEEACPLLKVNWLRMIVDEGHSMGRGKDNSSISFASWINSERRWAMTGTPTPQTSTQSGLANVFNLMQYLQHEFFTRRYDGDTVWNQLIVRSWNRGFVSAFFRLRSLLSLLMIRHVKSDISELPLPVFSINTLSMGYEEVSTYNTLVCAIQSNLVITSMKGKTSGAQDSLLHKSQTRHAREAISNLRLVCAGGTQVRPTLSDEYWTEFHQDFDNLNTDPVHRKRIRDFISRATSGQHSRCDCCGVMLSTLLVFPCGHLVCTECVDSDTTSCLVCDEAFDVDAFQRLQPGFKYDWLHNVEEETKHHHPGNGDDGKTNDGNDALVLPGGHGVLVPHNQRQRRARSRKFGDGHTCEYDPKSPDGKCVLCFTEHEPCYLAGERRCGVCYRTAQNCPKSESKITHIVEKLLRLYDCQKEAERSARNHRKHSHGEAAPARRTPKVIIFSQFRKVLNITGDRLLRRFGSGCIAEYWGKYRKRELNKFVRDDKCLCMLLGKDGSEGLDLSFVTHIVFLEQVWDKSLENQVVARAWRMGARGSVDVETLVAENSIEETMFLLEQQQQQQQQPDRESDDGSSSGSIGAQRFRATARDQRSSEYQRAKVHYLLNGLKLIADASTSALGLVGNEGKPDGSSKAESSSKKRRHRSGSAGLVPMGGAKKRRRVRFRT